MLRLVAFGDVMRIVAQLAGAGGQRGSTGFQVAELEATYVAGISRQPAFAKLSV